MYVRPTAPRSIGEVTEDAIRLYRESFGCIWMLSLVGSLLQGVINIYLSVRLTALTTSATVEGVMAAMSHLSAIEHSPGVWAAAVLIALVWLVTNAALITRQHAVATQRAESSADALGVALRRLPRMMVAALVWAAALTIATLLFIAPGIWLWGQLQLWLVALCVDDLGPFASLAKSWRLTERHWSRSSAVVGIVAIVIVVLSLCEDAVVGIAMAVLHSNVAAALVIAQLVSTLSNVVTAPMLTAALLAIYYDLQLRRDGLAARVASLRTA